MKKQLMRGWEVEWCAGCPQIPGTDDADLDNADLRFADFSNKDDAMKYAAQVLDKDFFGSVKVTEFEMQPLVDGFPTLTREYIGDSEFVD